MFGNGLIKNEKTQLLTKTISPKLRLQNMQLNLNFLFFSERIDVLVRRSRCGS